MVRSYPGSRKQNDAIGIFAFCYNLIIMNPEVRNYILPFCLVLLSMLVSPSLAAQNTKISEPGKALFYLSVDTLEESDPSHPAFILQDYLRQVTGNEFPIVQETAP